jgi:hypothetical protein
MRYLLAALTNPNRHFSAAERLLLRVVGYGRFLVSDKGQNEKFKLRDF